jgi:hypothetical protein
MVLINGAFYVLTHENNIESYALFSNSLLIKDNRISALIMVKKTFC